MNLVIISFGSIALVSFSISFISFSFRFISFSYVNNLIFKKLSSSPLVSKSLKLKVVLPNYKSSFSCALKLFFIVSYILNFYIWLNYTWYLTLSKLFTENDDVTSENFFFFILVLIVLLKFHIHVNCAPKLLIFSVNYTPKNIDDNMISIFSVNDLDDIRYWGTIDSNVKVWRYDWSSKEV